MNRPTCRAFACPPCSRTSPRSTSPCPAPIRCEHLEAVREQLPTQPADTLGWVVLTTGGNDLIHWYGLQPPRKARCTARRSTQAQPWIAAFAAAARNAARRDRRAVSRRLSHFPGRHLRPDRRRGGRAERLPAGTGPMRWPSTGSTTRACSVLAPANVPTCIVVPLHDTFLGHGIHCRQFWRQTYCREDPTYWYLGQHRRPERPRPRRDSPRVSARNGPRGRPALAGQYSPLTLVATLVDRRLASALDSGGALASVIVAEAMHVVMAPGPEVGLDFDLLRDLPGRSAGRKGDRHQMGRRRFVGRLELETLLLRTRCSGS